MTDWDRRDTEVAMTWQALDPLPEDTWTDFGTNRTWASVQETVWTLRTPA